MMKITTRKDGYRAIGGQFLEHVVIAERALGKQMPKGAQVHHVNGNKSDNRPENLVICPTPAYHSLLHVRQRAMQACGNPDWRPCLYCGKYDDPANLYIRGRHYRHRACFNKAWLIKYHESRHKRNCAASKARKALPDVQETNATQQSSV